MPRLGKSHHRVITEGDMRDVLLTHLDDCFDSVVTDPPYGLEFMGAGWDRGVPGQDFWYQILKAMKPGGYLLAFGGTRTSHRLTCAIEDAGFEIRDSIIWIYGSGFPKSQDIGKAIDKAAGVKREVVGVRPEYAARRNKKTHSNVSTQKGFANPEEIGTITAPATPEAQQWDGWGTALKPAHEPIIVARKPLSESTVAANVLKHGTGGMNIDGGRIGSMGEHKKPFQPTNQDRKVFGKQAGFMPTNAEGRWPANVILQHHDECTPVGTKKVKTGTTNSRKGTGTFAFGDHEKKSNPWVGEDGKEEVIAWECHPDCPVRLLDEQSGITTSGAMKREVPGYDGDGMFIQGKSGPSNQRSDTGGASRFFYQAKASNRERYFVCHQCNTVDNDRKAHKTPGWNPKEDGPDPHVQSIVFHPTQKPVGLIRYLVRLVTPPGGIVLDPFVGSGTLGVAAKAEGFNYLGIDNNPDYCRIARYRTSLKRI